MSKYSILFNILLYKVFKYNDIMKYFLFFWTIAIAIIPVSVILFIFGYWFWSLIFAFLAVVARTRLVRVVVRTGAWGTAPIACPSPQLLLQFKGMQPTIVGSAWGFFLQRRTATQPVLSMRNFTGMGTGTYEGWWAAGSTIETVLQSSDKTFPSHPSQADITIGSWFATGSHGSGGDIGSASSSVLHSVEIVTFDPPNIQICDKYEEIRAIFDNPSHNSAITWVKFHNLVPNDIVQKRAFDVVDIAGAEEWLSSGAILRVLFVGAARDGLGIRWERPYAKTEHWDPHCCSKCCTFLQADVCSACCGCKEDYSQWNGLTTLKEANLWVPPLIPLETWIAVARGQINFEFVFRVETMNAELLNKMVQLLRKMHQEIGGRAEIRYGTAVVFWDLSLQHSFERPFLLLKALGIQKVALHPGKAQPNIHIIPNVSIGEIYFNKQLNY